MSDIESTKPTKAGNVEIKKPQPRKVKKKSTKKICKDKLSKGFTAIIIVGIFTIASLSLLLITAIRTRSAVVIVKYDFNEHYFSATEDFVYGVAEKNPDESVKAYRYASPTNCTYKPYAIWVGYITEKFEPLGEEWCISQLTSDNFMDDFTDDLQNIVTGDEYYSFNEASKLVNANESGEFKLRISADYKIVLAVTYIADFDSIQYPDAIMNFLYMVNAGERSNTGKLLGNANIEINGGEATVITITGFTCHYAETPQFFNITTPETNFDVVPYPYILNITKTTDFWGYF